MPKEYKLDDLDRKILSMLLADAKRPYTDIAQELFVSGGTIHVRMNKMIAAGLVHGQTLLVDPVQLGYDITSFLGIYLDKSSLYEDALDALRKIPEVLTAHYTTGVYSIFVKVICRDTNHLRDVLQRVQRISGIQRTETFISLEEGINRPINLTDSSGD
ncbi:MAG: Lrp/AsnC ligand binding domain-containing protein [Bacteroidota bacterium]